MPGISIDDALSVEALIDEEFIVPSGASMLVDDPELTLTGAIDVPLDGSLVIL